MTLFSSRPRNQQFHFGLDFGVGKNRASRRGTSLAQFLFSNGDASPNFNGIVAKLVNSW